MTTNATGTCAFCGADDPLGTGLCLPCLATRTRGRTLIFIRGKDAGDAVASVLGPASNLPETQAALREGRPLVAVPSAIGARVLEALESLGFAARAVPASGAWRAVPLRFHAMLVCVLAAGAVAGTVAEPAFLWASPLFAATLLLLGHLSVRRPLLVPANDVLPGELRAEISTTLVGIRAGPAKDRLVDLLGIARPLAAAVIAEGDPARLRESINDLVRAACDTARETDRLIRTADVIRSSLVWTTEVAGEEQAGSARSALRRASDLAAQGLARLAETVSALGRVDADSAALDGPVGSELAELARTLEAAARVHVESFRELNELLA